MPSTDFHGTHTLLSGDYVDALSGLLDALFPCADRGLVRLDEEWLDEAPDVEDCAWAWDAIRGRFDRLSNRDEHGWTAWGVELDDPGRDAMRRLVELTNDAVGSHFVAEILLVRDGRTVLSAIPHHSDLAVDADVLREDAFAAAEASLAGLEACFVPVEPHDEWEAGNRRWSVGPAVCKETLDGRRTSCYGVSKLRGLRTADDGTTLELAWDLGEPLSEDPIGKALSWTLEKLHRPPGALPCGDEQRAERVADFLAETLRRYDGREIRV
ncbi:hypothetical protein NDI76_09470 [Halogeometricum sp. S1BR25-6]|uniref:Uncharacterized protein n=1 Tax=Halogeometricum salsisoli TaxID=2950536 RepID=A0ABU2GDU6_9EURY|nr:hypothetical protein [Halogeometricum sp. S1BR25-6]MDS0298975.1 hypothetical protein [Halogeometricum sp. S1BR25-6]